MWDAVLGAAAAAQQALAALGQALAGAAPGWLALGVVLHLANQVLRGRGWYAVVRTARPDDARLRRRDAIGAWVAGAAAGGVLSARGGDAVRVLLLGRRLPGAGCPLLVGTLAAEGVGEIAVGAVLVAVALGGGLGPELSPPPLPVALALAAAALLAGLAARRVARVREVLRRAGRGCTALRSPGAYAAGVLPWQVASRACRLGALACFLAAFGLPAVPAAVLLVVFAQTGSRVVPFGPLSVGAGVAVLAASFGPVTGTPVPPEQLAAFFVGMSTLLTLAGVAIAIPICLRSAGLGETLRAARGGLRPARVRLEAPGAQASAMQGRGPRALGAAGVPARATSLPTR